MSKEINLSASITCALESLKQAMQVLLGETIVFCGDFQIWPGPIQERSATYKKRHIGISGKYRKGIIYSPVFEFMATIDLENTGGGWQPDIIEFSTRPDHSWYLACWRSEEDKSLVGVTCNDFDDPDGKAWWVGHDPHDRHLVAKRDW